MKKNLQFMTLTVLWLVLFFALFSGFSYRADGKIGFINSLKVLSAYQPALDAETKFEEERAAKEKEYQDLGTVFQNKQNQLQNQQLILTDAKKAEAQKELETLYTEIQQFQAEHFDAQNGTLAQRWNAIMDPIIKDVQEAIDKYASENGFDIVFDQKEGFILFADEELDISDELIEELKKN
ncbi:OmpH family outer membrane protein [candidate division KSB1 bacterium]